MPKPSRYYKSNLHTLASKEPAARGHGHVRATPDRQPRRNTSPLLAKLLGGTGAQA